jgi:hypothetical protein
MIAAFLSASIPMADFPYIPWHLDPESTGDFRSFVTIDSGSSRRRPFELVFIRAFPYDPPKLSPQTLHA